MLLKKNNTPENISRFWVGRVIIGTLLAFAVTAIVLFAPRELLTLLVGIWVVLATWELGKILRQAEIFLNLWLISGLNITIVLAAYLNWLPNYLILPIFLIFLFAIATRPPLPRIPVYGLFTLIYLGFLPSHLILLRNLHLNRWLVLFPLVLTWVNDTAGYALGKLFGRRKLAPFLSPNKTIEGFFFGLLFSALVALLGLKNFSPFASQPVWFLALVGIGLGALAQAGDLFESLFKRAVGIKDSSSSLGEHGGFLDRIDSLIFTIPGFYYLTRLLLL